MIFYSVPPFLRGVPNGTLAQKKNPLQLSN